MSHSALFAGKVMHMRYRPKRHRLQYSVFSLLLDLDELPSLDKKLRLFGYNRRALISFHDKDHGDGQPDGLRNWVEIRLDEAGLLEPGMQIRVLCYPRILGYVFNPLTLYFCHGKNGLRAVLYEVCNTFGERHTYTIAVGASQQESIRQSCAKDFYVSPFVPMNCHYNFHIEPPGEKVLVRIDEEDPDGMLLVASFAANRQELNNRTLLSAFVRHPLMTLKITAGIYWEALLLWRKGAPIYRHSAATNRVASTVVRPSSAGNQAHDPR
jgi:DUF1365 family protein